MSCDCMPKSDCYNEDNSNPGCISIVPIFSALSSAEMMEVAAITREKTFKKGEMIYFAGKDLKRLFVLHRGVVKISRVSASGKVQVIRLVGPGGFFGELSILRQAALSDYAEAMEPCVTCTIEGSSLRELMKKYPSIALKVMEELSSRLEKAETLIETINLHSAEQRLAQSILALAGDSTEFELPVTKGDYASQLGMTQETLSRKLSMFQDQGFIELRGQRGIVLRDRKGLSKAK